MLISLTCSKVAKQGLIVLRRVERLVQKLLTKMWTPYALVPASLFSNLINYMYIYHIIYYVIFPGKASALQDLEVWDMLNILLTIISYSNKLIDLYWGETPKF